MWPPDKGAVSGFAASGGFLTRHAARRIQQRGIRAASLAALLASERVCRGPGNSEIVLLGKKYAVIGAHGAVVTVGHRTRRIQRD